MLVPAYLSSLMPHSGLDSRLRSSNCTAREPICRTSRLSALSVRAFTHTNDAKKLTPKTWEEILCGFSKKEALSYRIWNPNTRKVVESKNATFSETPPHLIPQPTHLSPLQELPFVKLDNDYASSDDLL